MEEIDNEYKTLLVYVNNAIEAITRSSSRQEIITCLQNLRKYTVFHFNNEEYAQHCREHEILKKKVKDLQHVLYQEKIINPDEVRLFFKHWLVEHIIQSDMKLKQCVPPFDATPKVKPLIEWSERFVINVEEIDQEHREIIATFNSIYEASDNANKRRFYNRTFLHRKN